MQVYLGLLLVALGIVIALALKRPISALTRRFHERAPIIKKYWLFIVPFVTLNIAAYIVVSVYFYSEINFNLVGQISATILAIFVGYIAFSEFGESKFDKLAESAANSTKMREYNSGKMKYEEAHAIKPKDAKVLGNLLEVYLILGLYDKFDSKIGHYKKISVEKTDELTYLYLLALKNLVREHLSEARTCIRESIEFVNENSGVRERFYWSNDEFLISDAYRLLGSSTQSIVNNYYSYLKRQLTDAQEQQFVQGDYENAGV